MPSYLRNVFGGSFLAPLNSSSPDSSSKKSHVRSHSAPQPLSQGRNLDYIYAKAPSTSGEAQVALDNNPTARPNIPSPLRHATYDSSFPSGPASTFKIHSTPSSPSKSTSQGMMERPPIYPNYKPSGSFGSMYSSSSSIYPEDLNCRPAPSRTSSSGSVATNGELRPALKSINNRPPKRESRGLHVAFLNPNRPEAVQVHPLFSSSRLHRAPISYDVMYPPSSQTVIDRHTRASIPFQTLTQPITDPSTMGRLVLKSDEFPWTIIACPSSGAVSGSGEAKSPRFYLGGSSSASRRKTEYTRPGTVVPLTNLDVMHALHKGLSLRVTPEEWEALGNESRAQRRVSRAYEKRCKVLGGGWEAGVRRIDFLGGKTALAGIEIVEDRSPSEDLVGDGHRVGKLIFSKA